MGLDLCDIRCAQYCQAPHSMELLPGMQTNERCQQLHSGTCFARDGAGHPQQRRDCWDARVQMSKRVFEQTQH